MNTTWNVPTDSENKITVESQLVYVMWNQGRAYAGFEAEFEVKTILVGTGAKVKVTCRTQQGKKLGTVEGTICLNRFRGKIVIPEKVKPGDYVYLEAKLPKHGLSEESNHIPVRAPIEVSSMQWSKTEVRRDEEVTLSCNFTNGVEEGDDVTVVIYEYDNDDRHDEVVKIPTVIKNNKVELTWNFLFQDDTDDIPTEGELQKYGKSYNSPEYFFVVMVDRIPVGKNQESGILNFLDFIEFIVADSSGTPITDKPFTITFADGSKRDGTLDSKGCARFDDIPAGPYIIDVEGMPPLKGQREPIT
jgi:hypothetical protein